MDKPQLEKFYRDYVRFVAALARKELRNPADVEDVVQDVFRRVARVPVPEYPRAYLAIVVPRVAAEFARKHIPADDRMVEVADPDGHRQQDELLTRMALRRIFDDTTVFLTMPEQQVFRLRRKQRKGPEASAAALGITERTLRRKLKQAVTAAHLYAAEATGELTCDELAEILSGDEQPDKKREGVTKHWRGCATCGHHVAAMMGRITVALAAVPALFLGTQVWRQASTGILGKAATVAAVGLACGIFAVQQHELSIEPSPADAAPGPATTSVQPPGTTSPPRTTDRPTTGRTPRTVAPSSEKPVSATTSPQSQIMASSQPSMPDTVRGETPPSISVGNNAIEPRRLTTVNPNRCGDIMPGTSLVRVEVVSPIGVTRVTLTAWLHGKKTVREMARGDGTAWVATVGAYPDGTDAGTIEVTVVAEGGNGVKTAPKEVGEICLYPCG